MSQGNEPWGVALGALLGSELWAENRPPDRPSWIGLNSSLVEPETRPGTEAFAQAVETKVLLLLVEAPWAPPANLSLLVGRGYLRRLWPVRGPAGGVGFKGKWLLFFLPNGLVDPLSLELLKLYLAQLNNKLLSWIRGERLSLNKRRLSRDDITWLRRAELHQVSLDW